MRRRPGPARAGGDPPARAGPRRLARPKRSARTSCTTPTPCGGSSGPLRSTRATSSSRSGPASDRSRWACSTRRARVVAVEVDPVLAAALPLTVRERARRGRPARGGRSATRCARPVPGPPPTALVANLPYNVAVPVLLHLLETLPERAARARASCRPRSPTGLPPARVHGRTASRPSRRPGTPTVRRAGAVPRAVFWPVPNVDSGLVAFERRGRRRRPRAAARCSRVVDAAFAQRRKTLRAALARLAGSADAAERALARRRDRPAHARRATRRRAVRRARGRARRASTRGPRGRRGRGVSAGVTVRAPAKVNLLLAVGPPRPDGYHDLATVFHAVSLYDEVTATPAEHDDEGRGDGRRRGARRGRRPAGRAQPGRPRGPAPRRPHRRARAGAPAHPQGHPRRRRDGRRLRRRGGRPRRLRRALADRAQPGGAARDRGRPRLRTCRSRSSAGRRWAPAGARS